MSRELPLDLALVFNRAMADAPMRQGPTGELVDPGQPMPEPPPEDPDVPDVPDAE